MKKCKIYSTRNKVEAEAVIINGHVLLPAPRRSDIEPAHISEGQCYYPPFYAVVFAENMNFNLVPFKTECEWGEYNNGKKSLVHRWFEYEYMSEYFGMNENFREKCGYCDAETGKIRIPPEMEYCADFNAYGAAIFGGVFDENEEQNRWKNRAPEYRVTEEVLERRIKIRDDVYSGLINTKGEIITSAFDSIEESYHGLFFAHTPYSWDERGWGAVDSKGTELLNCCECADIIWDGIGGLTIMNYSCEIDDQKTYGIINLGNGYDDYRIADYLTCKPTIYDFPTEYRRENISLGENYYFERFRLTQINDKYGLVRDVVVNQNKPLETYSEEILEPIYNYEDIPTAAYDVWVDREVHYYARVMDRTPRHVPEREGDGWDVVPQDIRENVRVHMLANDMEQPEDIEALKEKPLWEDWMYD